MEGRVSVAAVVRLRGLVPRVRSHTLPLSPSPSLSSQIYHTHSLPLSLAIKNTSAHCTETHSSASSRHCRYAAAAAATTTIPTTDLHARSRHVCMREVYTYAYDRLSPLCSVRWVYSSTNIHAIIYHERGTTTPHCTRTRTVLPERARLAAACLPAPLSFSLALSPSHSLDRPASDHARHAVDANIHIGMYIQ